jgi:RNA polymerase sigma factor (sigma-70 family)
MTDESTDACANSFEETESVWVQRLQPGLRALLLRWTRDPDMANDLHQDAMIAVIQAVREGRVRNRLALPAYARQTAHNLWLMQLRKPSVSQWDDANEPASSAWGESPQTPDDRLTQAQMQHLAHAVLDEMSTERDRDLIRAFYLDGKSKPDLMARWQLSAEHFDRVIGRARDRMKKALQERLHKPGQQRLQGAI